MLNTLYWDEATGLYRSDLTKDVAVYTPLDLAAAYSGIREIILASPAHRARPILQRYARFWVQSLDNSGMQMSEDHNTGEVSFGLVSADHDHDGIPFAARSHGPYGVAPIPAGVVAINLGGPGNPRFQCIDGEPHIPCGPVAATYEPDFEHNPVLLPEVEPEDDTYFQRETMERWEGLTLRLANSKKNKIGSDLSGEEIFRRNCMVCHGQRGEGIFGFSLDKAMFEFTQDAVIDTVTKGRFLQMMPTWGEGIDELNLVETDEELIIGNVLTEEEIERVVNYLKSGLAKKYKQTETIEAYLESQDHVVEEIPATARAR